MLPRRTGARLSLWAALITTAAALITAGLVLVLAWRQEVDRIDAAIQEIRSVHQSAAMSDVWDMSPHLDRTITSISQLPHVAYISVMADSGFWERGTKPDRPGRMSQFGLVHPVGGQIGVLSVQFSQRSLAAAVFSRWWIIAVMVITPVVVAGLAFLLLYRHLVGRHLIDLGHYVADLHLDHLDRTFAFKRRAMPPEDELETVARSLTVMRSNLATEVGRRRDAEERIRQLQKMETLGQLAGGVAHDFNNALTGILGSADLLRLELPLEHPGQEYARTIIDASRRSADLTRKLLAFARKGTQVQTTIEVHQSLETVVALLSRTLDPNITIICKLQADSPRIRGDSSEIENALLNLCLNARDAMPNGGKLMIGTAIVQVDAATAAATKPVVQPGRFVRITVGDTGTGMSPEILSRIYEPFFTTKDLGKGTGLGLAAVFGTVGAHRGVIDVSSMPGRGTTFTIDLPFETATGRPRSGTTTAYGITRPGRALIIDDEPVVRAVARSLLERQGWTTCEAEDGSVGLRRYRDDGPWDAVLLDLAMPGMDGPACFRGIRAVDPDARVVICTGYAKDASIETLLAAGARGFVTKPYLANDLWKAIELARS